MTNIGSNAFSSCTELTGIVLPATPVLTVGENALTPEMIVIVPTESWSDYMQATGWSDYAEQMNRDKETLTLPNNLQWRTYYSRVGRLLPDGVKAYTITNIGDTEVMTSQALDYIPAGQAVLIENTGKTVRAIEAETSLLTYAQTDTPVCLLTAPEDNLLQWITEPTPVSAGEGYTLYKDEFVKVSSGTLPAGIAFLPASGNSRSRLGIYVFEDETTHISSLGNETIGTDNGHWFTLDGKKLSGKPVNKGVYLKNGKKVVIR